MNSELKDASPAEVAEEFSVWGVGLGIVGVALFPLSLPIVALTLATLVLLAVPLLAVGLLAIPLVLARHLATRLRAPASLPRLADTLTTEYGREEQS
jgi:hypothetical protein